MPFYITLMYGLAPLQRMLPSSGILANKSAGVDAEQMPLQWGAITKDSNWCSLLI
jgi:hypothetical protein